MGGRRKSGLATFGGAAITLAVLGAAGLLSAQTTTAPATPPAARGGRPAPVHVVPDFTVEVAGVKPIVMKLWEGDAPNQRKDAAPEWDDGTGRIYGVTEPGIIVYLPPEGHRNGVAIVACMGGSYQHLTKLVGADETVKTFVSQGVAIISLKYRLKPPSTHVEDDALADGRRAVQMTRFHAKEWGIDPNKIGMVGWSAGGNLILNQVTHPLPTADAAKSPDPVATQNEEPNFVGLMSPWPDAHKPDAYPVPKDAPPAFIGNAEDDHTAPVEFARAIGDAWKAAGAKVEMDIVPTGGHGAFEIGSGTAKDWPDKFVPWLKSVGMWGDPK